MQRRHIFSNHRPQGIRHILQPVEYIYAVFFFYFEYHLPFQNVYRTIETGKADNKANAEPPAYRHDKYAIRFMGKRQFPL